MATDAPDSDVAAILQAVHGLHAAMTAGDTRSIAALIAEDYALVHITGYRQPCGEWIEAIWNRDFVYHAITVDAATLQVDTGGDGAEVSGRGVFDATINGMHAPWRLQFTMALCKTAGKWQFTHSRYASF